MKNLPLKILQFVAQLTFVLSSAFLIVLALVAWWMYFTEGARIPLDVSSLNIVIFGQAVSEEAVGYLLSYLNQNFLTAGLSLLIFTLFLGLTLLPVYWIKQFLLALKPGHWFVQANTKRLRYLAVYFLALAATDALLYVVGLLFFGNAFVEISFGNFSEMSYFLTGFGVLVLSYMYQHGVKLREEAELTV